MTSNKSNKSNQFNKKNNIHLKPVSTLEEMQLNIDETIPFNEAEKKDNNFLINTKIFSLFQKKN